MVGLFLAELNCGAKVECWCELSGGEPPFLTCNLTGLEL